MRREKQAEAAELLGLTQPKLSNMLRGHFHGFSERRLIDCLTRLGRDVQIVVKEKQSHLHGTRQARDPGFGLGEAVRRADQTAQRAGSP